MRNILLVRRRIAKLSDLSSQTLQKVMATRQEEMATIKTEKLDLQSQLAVVAEATEAKALLRRLLAAVETERLEAAERHESTLRALEGQAEQC